MIRLTDEEWERVESKLNAHIHAAYSLAEIATTLGLIGARKAIGKVILRP